ncbi:MAG: DMT family transporter [Anaerolineales bacterium]|nr:MAG: DMT family transporter [Anaerolineales bacterium]
MRLKADLTLLLVSILWGSAFVAQRVAGQMGGVYYFNGLRYLLAALVVLPFVGQIANLTNAPKPQFKWMFLAGFLLFVASALQQAGMQYTSAGNAGFITSLYVVLIPIVLFLFWRERQHWTSIVAVALAGAGAFLLSTGGQFEVRAGDALELGGAFFWAIHVIVLGKFASKFEPIGFSVGQLAVCGILNLLVGFFAEDGITLHAPILFAIAYTAFLSLGLSYTLQVWAQKHTPPADAALILSLESVFAVLAGWLMLDERLNVIQLFGCVMIFVAVVLSQARQWSLQGTIDRDHLIEGR